MGSNTAVSEATSEDAGAASGITLVSPDGGTLDVDSSQAKSAADQQSPSETGSGSVSDLNGAKLDVEVPPELLAQLEDPGHVPEVPEETESDFQARSPIGTDERVKVADVRAAPYIQTPFIGVQRPDGGYMCTGFLIGDHALATAAHCFYQNGIWSTNYSIYFGLSGTTAVASCTVNLVSLPSQWTSSEDPNYDWAMVQLNCNAGAVFGYYGFQQVTGVPALDYTIVGYPGDKYTSATGYTMWRDSDPIQYTTSHKLWYLTDTAGGQSGAPIYRLQSGTSCGNCVIGIHTNGTVTPWINENSGTMVTAQVFNSMSLFRDNWLVAT